MSLTGMCPLILLSVTQWEVLEESLESLMSWGLKMKMMVILPAVLSCLFFSLGCQSNKENASVLERSSEVKPPWVLGAYQGFEGSKDYLLHYTSGNIKRLELGIRQTQIEGMGKTQELFEQRFRKDVSNLFDRFPGKGKNAISKQEVESKTNQVLTQTKVVEASPKSVYWEKVSIGSPGASQEVSFEYTVTVLLALPRSEYNGAMAQLTGALETATQPAAKEFGVWLNQAGK